ncbi:sensor histidine kinase [Halorubrum vacuolatum]|uniref:sensor histidine kinase n=1 Tax=Halorubrum vacuolatum TaxID=63740 RepID=UPI0015C5E810|nr:ATP-binding protein [Halorubrum vacuolatum]
MDLSEPLQNVVSWAAAEHPDAEISLEFETDTTETIHVKSDETIQRAIRELIENGILHGGSQPEVTVAVRSSTADTVEVAVIDGGTGIPDHEWAVISGQEEVDQLTHASGLGLWLARWITESNGGQLTRNTTEDGEEVVITLQEADGSS